jgi:hypothetical protein
VDRLWHIPVKVRDELASCFAQPRQKVPPHWAIVPKVKSCGHLGLGRLQKGSQLSKINYPSPVKILWIAGQPPRRNHIGNDQLFQSCFRSVRWHSAAFPSSTHQVKADVSILCGISRLGKHCQPSIIQQVTPASSTRGKYGGGKANQ